MKIYKYIDKMPGPKFVLPALVVVQAIIYGVRKKYKAKAIQVVFCFLYYRFGFTIEYKYEEITYFKD